MVGVLSALLERQPAQAVQQVRALAAELRDEDYDFEAASNFATLLNRITRTELRLPEADSWIALLAERFSTSKATNELLTAAVQGHEAHERIVHDTHTRIVALAEAAMTHSVRGAPGTAVRSLLQDGGQSLNAKLIELAVLVLQRHAQRIENHAELSCQAEALRQRYCAKGTRVSVGESGRPPGGLVLRSGGKAVRTALPGPPDATSAPSLPVAAAGTR